MFCFMSIGKALSLAHALLFSLLLQHALSFPTFLPACSDCPVGTAPEVGFEYKWWNKMPSNMRSSVFSREYSDSHRSTGKRLTLN